MANPTAEILESLQKVTSKDATTFSYDVRPYQSNKDAKDQHQFIFFLKPELTSTGVKLDKILDLIFKRFDEAKITIAGVRILAGDYLDQNNVMSEHYGVISQISREGTSAISDEAKANLQSKFGEDINKGVETLGGHQFLAKYKEFNPFSLTVLNDNLGTVRLAGGTYALKIKLPGGKAVIVLNPFHAYQLVPYTSKGNSIIVFECLSPTSWADLRNKVCGATDPAKAQEGSIRNLLLKHKDDLGLKQVDMGANGVHMSAGPLEGMVELIRFFSDKSAGKHVGFLDTNFGSLLQSSSVSEDKIKSLSENQKFQVDGKSVSAFDLTEEKNASDAVKLLVSKL